MWMICSCGLPEEVDLLLQLFGVEVDIKVQGPFVEPGDEFSYFLQMRVWL